MKKANLKLFIYLVLLIILFLVIYYIANTLYGEGSFNSINDIMTFSIGIVSLLISVIALMISLSTYFSIDSVNALSSMEGNVLCNENYNAEYQILVNEFSDCKDAIELEEKLYDTLYTKLKKDSKTCMQFTDRIQEILDHILWYAYTDSKTDVYKEHIREMIELVDTRYSRFNSISNGNQYLLKEHIKLIKNVLNYQSVAHEGEIVTTAGGMLNIRGRLFSNAVSKTIYYDYLGLEYHKKALTLLREKAQFDGEEFLLENMKKIAEHKWSDSDKVELNIYLAKAAEAFEQACLSSQEDILWKGYISFNKARVDLLTSLVQNDFSADWDKSILESIDARYTVLMLLAPQNEDSFLLAEFKKEYYYARALYLIMLAYKNPESLQSTKENALIILSEIPSPEDINGAIFKRTRLYLEDIIK